MDLNDKIVNVSADGKSITDYRNHILKDGEEINLNITNKK